MAYTTAAAFRERLSPNSFTASDEVIGDTITEFEEVAEDYLGVAYQARSATEAHLPRCANGIRLHHTDATAVTAITYETGTAPTPSASTVTVDPGGIAVLLPRGTYWPDTKVTLTYSYGTATVPQRLVKACHLYVALTLQQEISGSSRDVIAQAFDGATTRYSTPNKADRRPTGWLDVDRLLNNFPTKIPGMA